MTLDVKSAKVMLECVKRGSLGRAAIALELSQPAVTRTIRQLERDYGVALFERNTRGVVTTMFGEALLPYARLLVSEANNASLIIDQMKGASRGVVRVGGVGSVIEGVLVNAISAMRMDYQDVQFHIVEELEDNLLDSLKAGKIDLAISPQHNTDNEVSLAMSDALFDRVSIYTRAQNPLLSRKHINLETVAKQNWALPPEGTPIMQEWLRRFHGSEIEPRSALIVSRSIQVIKSAIAADNLLCWLPDSLVKTEIKNGDFVEIALKEMEWLRTFRGYSRRKGLASPSLNILLQYIRKSSVETALQQGLM